MKTILAIGASSSKKSINRTLANHAARQVENAEVVSPDLNDFELPIYSVDREEESGIPELAKSFAKHIQDCDGIVLSLAEHNGSYTAAFKNIFDWASRHDQKVWAGKPMLLLSTSPGGRGGASVMQTASQSFPHLGAEIVGAFSLPSYYDNFSEQEGIKDAELAANFREQLALFADAVGA